jgi:hypothetical protein
MSFMLLGILNSQASGGAGTDFDLLATTTLTSSAANVSFTGLDSYSGYKHLQIRAVFRTDRGGSADQLWLNVNNDYGANYAWHRLGGSGSSAVAASGSSYNYMTNYYIAAADADAGNFGAFVFDFLDHNSTNKNTTIRSFGGFVDSGNQYVTLNSGLHLNTSALTSVSFDSGQSTANMVAGTRISLIGVK